MCVCVLLSRLAESQAESFKSDVVRSVVGEGRARRAVLPTGGAAGGDKVASGPTNGGQQGVANDSASTRPPIVGIVVADALTHHPHPAPR